MSKTLPFEFKTAERKQCKASILIEGLTGSGKSGLALCLAKALASDYNKVFAVDTENDSLPLFAGIKSTMGETFDNFKILNFKPDVGYKPTNYLACREMAIEEGAEVVIFDSISHAWQYNGGILDILNKVKASSARYERDSYAAWGAPEVTTEKLKIFELIRTPNCHMISTVRVKEKMDYGTDKDGKTTLVSLGEQEIMQADLKYEPDLVLHMLQAGCVNAKGITYPKAKVIKSRYTILEKDEIYEFTPSLCTQIAKYLSEGTSPEELLEEQRQEYIKTLTEILKSSKPKQNIWKILLKEAGYEGKKLAELPLPVIKENFIKLTVD